jgi:hypothetical protein
MKNPMSEDYQIKACPVERIVLLPVCEATGEVDYMYLEYDLQTIEDTQQEHLALIDGWEFRPFRIVPAT